MILSHQTILERCQGDRPLISPFLPEKVVINGKSAGASSASYDCRIDHDLVLGINPAFIIRDHIIAHGFGEDHLWLLQAALRENPPMQALAYTVEDFCIPADVSGAVADKSSYARVFVSAFNTFFDPGFHGNATLELVNHGEEPVRYAAGDPVCQFIFSFLDKPTKAPYDGKYQHQTKAAHGARYELKDGTFTFADEVDPATPLPVELPVLSKSKAPHAQAWRDVRQSQMRGWIERIWGATALHPHERVERLYEETCELAQAEGVVGGTLATAVDSFLYDLDRAGGLSDLETQIAEMRAALRDDRLAQIATQVYAKPVSDTLAQEVGGISTCLLAYCEARGLSADFCEAAELARILDKPPEHFRERHARKIASGMARPLEEHGQ